ncbi:Methylamine utilisation protein MauE [Chitinophaga sp. CF118]|uniref:MauE/DoxX family redox-associated membrane protein n=1 Tax=Chitinophaga sp. CF118 TaxID=1884367 RepID=UPI0008F186DA|nr:MauE/DoxX family redox-associated membrane protein [Chitinophaga sp. CF118]SFD78805.1 Methylamine utilisation protein MauE [Chitinophaga sp. CF118]
MFKKNAPILISYLLVILFVYGGLTKLFDLHIFRSDLSKFPFIKSYAGTIAWLLPVVEFIIAAILLWPGTRLWGLYSSFLLLLVFSVYIILMLTSTSHEIPCACGGIFRLMTWMGQLKINIAFMALTSIGIWLQSKENAAEIVLR